MLQCPAMTTAWAETVVAASAAKLLKKEPEVQPLVGNRYFLVFKGDFGAAELFRRLPRLPACLKDMIALRCAVRFGHDPGYPDADGFAQRPGQSCK